MNAPEASVGGKAMTKLAYDPSDGFVVHEWGTFTSVSGSDGALLPGLHHEEEDLPRFVADRMAVAKDRPDLAYNPAFQKMETPVTYFYAPAPIEVTAKVAFPKGIFTQWYPFVETMDPLVAEIGGKDRYTTPVADIPEHCRERWHLHDGLLDWAKIDVLAADAQVVLPGPVENTTWGFARRTRSNPLRIHRGDQPAQSNQVEKFLFYRGLGDLEFPVKVTIAGEVARIANADSVGAMGGLVLMRVTHDAAGFQSLGDLAPGETTSASIPEAKMAHGDFVPALKSALASRLVESGLFADEAQSMVDTWERSYFLTPGVRLLYLLPQATTDKTIPLTITPAPAKMTRTMVIRMELMPPSDERKLSVWLTALAGGAPEQQIEARRSFLGLGRFAQPHLTRAVALASSPAEKAAGEKLLDEIAQKRRWAPVAAE